MIFVIALLAQSATGSVQPFNVTQLQKPSLELVPFKVNCELVSTKLDGVSLIGRANFVKDQDVTQLELKVASSDDALNGSYRVNLESRQGYGFVYVARSKNMPNDFTISIPTVSNNNVRLVTVDVLAATDGGNARKLVTSVGFCTFQKLNKATEDAESGIATEVKKDVR
jgi:hypothetical protein